MLYLHKKRIAEGNEFFLCWIFFLTKEELKELQEELAQASTTAHTFL